MEKDKFNHIVNQLMTKSDTSDDLVLLPQVELCQDCNTQVIDRVVTKKVQWNRDLTDASWIKKCLLCRRKF